MRKTTFFLLLFFAAFFLSGKRSSATVIIPSNNSSVIVPGDPDPGKVKAAMDEFKNLSKKEKRGRIKEVKAAIKHYRQEKKEGKDVDTDTLLLVILAILLPPLAVYLHDKEATTRFWLTLLLFVLGVVGAFILSPLCWLAAVIVALVIVLQGRM